MKAFQEGKINEQTREKAYQQWLRDQQAITVESHQAAEELRERARKKKRAEDAAEQERIEEENFRAQLNLQTDEEEKIRMQLGRDLQKLDQRIASETNATTKKMLGEQLQLRVKQAELDLEALATKRAKEKQDADEKTQEDIKNAKRAAMAYTDALQQQFKSLNTQINALINLDNIEVSVNRVGDLIESMTQKMRVD